MTIAYFDCFSGVSGDMVLGSLIDAGMPLSYLKKKLKLLALGSYELKLIKSRSSIEGTNLSVIVKKELATDSYKSLDNLIAKSKLNKCVKVIARAIFERLALAEGKVHGVSLDKVHFHEVGAVDSVIDVVGAAIGFDYFGFDAIYASPIPMARGRVKCAHGTFPVPAPATLELLKGVQLEPSPIREEIVTPTGAAILTTVAGNFGECPLQKVERVAYGFGDKVIPGVLNALRLMIGEGFPVLIVESDIDDMNPQIFDYVIEKLFASGAVDVNIAPIQMKKNRPAVRLSAIVPWDRKEIAIDIIMKETTTFGVRYWPVERRALVREFVQKKIKKGGVTFKVGFNLNGKPVKIMPEFEDVKKLAIKQKRPLIEVYREMMCDI